MGLRPERHRLAGVSDPYRIAPLADKNPDDLKVTYANSMRTAMAIFSNRENAVDTGLIEES
jgi:hypothetical protein